MPDSDIQIEGMKALRRADGGVSLFRADEHVARFNRSAQRMAMPAVDAQLHLRAIGRIGFRGRDYTVSGAHSAPVARRLYQALTDIQYGRVPDAYGWTIPLDAPAPTQPAAAL